MKKHLTKTHLYFIILKKKERRLKMVSPVQEWLPFERILDDGIIVFKKKYVKIIRVIPINYDLKSNLEKEAILNSYKLFLKVCDFDIQIVVQSRKENLNSYISQIENQIKKEESNKLEEISKSFIEYIKKQNILKNSSSKNFYIIVSFNNENSNIEKDINLKLVRDNLKDKFLKIKDALSRCGNQVLDINTKKEVEEILYSFYNFRKSLKFI
jgi:hypothetical protein